ncbi:hypothetical protein ACF0H5_006046 [Mactra antiquata]
MDQIKTFQMEGMIAATFTPMTPDGEVDYDKYDKYCQHLADNGIHQIYVNGTTGEGFSLTLEEREKVVEKWIEVGKKTGRITKMVVQVGALNMHDTIALVDHALSVGADAIATVPPLFFKPKTLDYLVKYCKEVANAAPNIPFYFYHLPSVVGVELNNEDFLKAASKEIPSLVGIKFSSKDLVDLIGCVHVNAPNRDSKRYNMLFGCDEMVMSGMVMGAQGGVGSTYNFLPKVIQRIMDKTKKGETADALADQYLVQKACRVMYKYGDLLGNNVSSLKAIMPLIGMDLGPARSPLRPPTAEELESYKKELLEAGMDKW